jgi:hypothetical protein
MNFKSAAVAQSQPQPSDAVEAWLDRRLLLGSP